MSRAVVLVLSLVIFVYAPAAEHPRLYFSQSDLPRLKADASGAKALQFQRLSAWGESFLDREPPAGIGTSERHHETAFSVITNYGLLWQLTGNRKYLAAGRKWLEALIETPTASEGNYHIGIFAASLAHGYDLLYGGLDSRFRKLLREKAFEVMAEARRGADRSWWARCYLHHDFWIPLAGLGIAAICFADEHPDADSLKAFCVSELETAASLLGSRGYWPEGVADWVYGMAPTFMFHDALVRSGGPDLFEREWFRKTAFNRLLHWCPDDSYMFIGDSYRSGRYGALGSAGAHVMMKLAARFGDSHAQWLAFREARVDSAGPPGLLLDPPYSQSSWRLLPERELHGPAWQFLWLDPSLKATPPDSLPTDRLFPNWDTALMRAGWGPDDPVLAFSGGHQLGGLGTDLWRQEARNLAGGLAHVHQNAGSVYLWADGSFPLSPPGYGGRDGRFHSTVMVDGHGQYFNPGHRGRITSFDSGEGWAAATMDVTGAYPENVGLERFERSLVFLKPRTVVLRDRLVTRDGNRRYSRRYEWLLQTDPSEAEWSASGDSLRAVSRRDGRRLLDGRVFPSESYFFETQSMDRPNNVPAARALSVTLIGRVPAEVEISSALRAPAPGESESMVSGVKCIRNRSCTALITPRHGREPSRAVLFAAMDTLFLAPEVLTCDFILVRGLEPRRIYRVLRESGEPGVDFRLTASNEGPFRASEAGSLVLKEPY